MKVWRGKEKVEIDLAPPALMPKPIQSGSSGIQKTSAAAREKAAADCSNDPPIPRPRRERPVQRPWMAMTVPPLPTPVPVTVFYRGSVSSFNLPPEKAELLMMFCRTADCKVPEPLPEPSDFRKLPNETPMGPNGLNGSVEEVSTVEVARKRSIFRFIEQRNKTKRCKTQNVQGQVGTS